MSIETAQELQGLRRGDVVKLEVTAELDGFYADACVTAPCGPISPAARRLITAGRPLVLTA
jgi:methionyl aminopeptidase